MSPLFKLYQHSKSNIYYKLKPLGVIFVLMFKTASSLHCQPQ